MKTKNEKADALVMQVGDRSFVLAARGARVLAEDLLRAATKADEVQTRGS